MKEALPLTEKGLMESGKVYKKFFMKWGPKVATAHISYQRSVAQNLVLKKQVIRFLFEV